MVLFKHLKERVATLVAVTALVAFITVATVYSTALSSEVEISCGEEIIVVERTADSVYSVLADNGIFVDAFDNVTPGLDVSVEDVDHITVQRGTAVNFTEGDSTLTYKTRAKTVEEFFKEKGITIGEYDEITPELTQSIVNGMDITLVRGDILVKEDTVQIRYKSEKKNNSELKSGETKVVRNGQNGKKVVRTEIKYRNGKEISRRVLSEDILVQPISEVVEVGTKKVSSVPQAKAAPSGNTVTAPDGTVYTYSKMISCNATAYDASYESNGKWGPVSATGKPLAYGMVAVDPRVIPLGTRLYIETPDGSWVYGYAVAEDTGGAIKGNKVDLFYPTRAEALRFGRRTVNVYILN